jgi:UDP-N-acetylmuramoyl-L-alanyl-D-glutamate--2,6-diaminopimelate ligase
MQELGSIINSINPLEVVGDINKKISNLVIDSRKAAQGSLFFAWVGTQTDGHQYIDAAIEQGAVAVVCERIPDEPKEAVTYLKVENSMAIVGAVASAWYQYPSRQMKVVGVTGTNGKTSICTLLFDLFKNLGFKTGLLSTVENKINDRIIPSTHTTPDPVSIQALSPRKNNT